MKQCRYCKKFYPESNFGVALTTPNKIYYRHKCRECYSVTKKNLRKNKRIWLIEYKKTCECIKCGVNDYRVLEFHHLDQKDKEFAISWAHDNTSIDKIKKEIEKCVVLCANCHRVLHWEEMKK